MKKETKAAYCYPLENKEIYNTIIKTTDIYLELINAVINILYKELCNL